MMAVGCSVLVFMKYFIRVYAGVGGLQVKTKQILDGMNVWPALIANTTSPRHEMLISLTPPHYPTPEKPHASVFIGKGHESDA